jgi:Protein of unknown function (DUF1573)
MRILLLLLLTVEMMFAADLTFTQETVILTPKPGAQSATAKYTFTNTGSTSLTITGVQPSCGCTTIALDKRSYDPGEKGEIIALIDLNGLGGTQHKSIEVSHDRGPVIALNMTLVLCDLPQINPLFLAWKVGAPATEQESIMTMPAGVDEQAVEVTSSSPEVTTQLVKRDDGTWALKVTPNSTAAATNAMLKVTTNFGRVVRVFASVTP